MIDIVEYLVSYGCLGDFGRFRPTRPLTCRRGDRAVVRSHRGLELGAVLCEARPLHAHFLPNTSVGQLLRLAGPDDEQTAEQTRLRGQDLYDDACRLAVELSLPLHVVDVEVLLDGEHTLVHLLRTAECDVRPFVSGLSRRHGVHVALQDLTHPVEAAPQGEGCGEPGCGKANGGCGSCGSGGGCSTCATAPSTDEQAHFAELRRQMEERRHALL